MLSQVVELIESKQRFMITAHVRPDGDSLGSSLALYWILVGLGKDAVVIMRDRVPHSYQSLPGAEDVVTMPEIVEHFDGAFVIECSDIDRPGLIGLERQNVVNIDHHSTTALFGNINWIDATASAVGEMIYNLCKALGVTPTKEIATCTYTALLTDTGSFQFSNTTERTFKIASELVRRGVEPAQVAQALYYSYPFSKIKLLGLALSTLERDETGAIAWIRVGRDAMELASASEEDADGIVNYALSIGDVKAVAFFKELDGNSWRISLRSKNKINVARVAEKFGGGGHKNASGCSVEGDFEDVSERVITGLREAVLGVPV
ncbi:MAG TPA: bifunctional oligoribonuclease/PAP phosphatase NrnA [Blastocatellia bacterium]|nr:bifunctional oligoribonuclease/PAP phosphatase NrnA [Blastocatellia bacterium]